MFNFRGGGWAETNAVVGSRFPRQGVPTYYFGNPPRDGQCAAGTHPTGMHSCLICCLNHKSMCCKAYVPVSLRVEFGFSARLESSISHRSVPLLTASVLHHVPSTGLDSDTELEFVFAMVMITYLQYSGVHGHKVC